MANSSIALIGSDSIMGREIRDIAATSTPPLDLRLIGSEQEEVGKLTLVGDEPAVVSGLDAAGIAGHAALLLAGPAEACRKALELWDREPSGAVIDLTFVAEDRADARLRAPAVEAAGEAEADGVHVIAHPAAIALAVFLRRLHLHDEIRRSVVQILAPASEQGRKGLEELQQQSVNLLSFKPLPKEVFDAQVGFNLLARYGEEAPAALEETEARIERHLATLLNLPGEGEGAPMPSLRLIQAPVFHGYSFSIWVEFESNPGVEAIENGLASEWIDVRGPDTEPPTNVGHAGQGGIAVGAIAEDQNDADACWFWMVTDNLRLVAENALGVVRNLA